MIQYLIKTQSVCFQQHFKHIHKYCELPYISECTHVDSGFKNLDPICVVLTKARLLKDRYFCQRPGFSV